MKVWGMLMRMMLFILRCVRLFRLNFANLTLLHGLELATIPDFPDAAEASCIYKKASFSTRFTHQTH